MEILNVRTLKTVLILFIFTSSSLAQQISIDQASFVAKRWAESQNQQAEISNIICKTVENDTIIYIVNFQKAWVMVSANMSLRPILGFSFDSQYTAKGEPNNVKSLFRFYAYAARQNREIGINYLSDWESAQSKVEKSSSSSGTVEPLLPVTWNQDWPYNAYCPEDSEMGSAFNGRHNTSCGPTAFAQILRYWKYPVRGTGSHSYYYDRFGTTVSANFGSTEYNWDNMPVSLDYDDPESRYKDIANLMVHAAVAVDKSWSSGGSLSQYTSAAVRYFGYAPTCRILYRDDYSNTAWHSIFRDDLNNGRPIMICANSAGSADPWEYGINYGHYFVCDGYYGSDYYHINWGWEGSGNGYFPLFSFGSFVFHNHALIGLEPNYDKKELVLSEPHSNDNNTVVLMHFDGDLNNESSLSENPSQNGSVSFEDNSSLGLGQCLYLNNSDQANQSHLSIPDNDNLDLDGDWTIEMWFKPNSFGNSGNEQFTMVSKPDNNGNYNANYSASIMPNNHYIERSLVCSFYPSPDIENNTGTIRTDKGFLNSGQWYHFSFIRNTSDKTMSLVIHDSNKKLIHYASDSYHAERAANPRLNSNPLYIGFGYYSKTYFNGYIDELRISNVVREFEITSTSLALTTPNGGEAWQSGTLQAIRWTSQNIANLKIEYSINNGDSWQLISESYSANQGSYFWQVPDIVSKECLVKISDVSNDNVFQTSSAVFEIFDHSELTLLAPNGGESYQCGSEIPIIWETHGINNIDISFSSDGGGSWSPIISGHSVDDIPFYWTVPSVTTSNYKIKIGDGNISTESAGSFTVVETEVPGGPYVPIANTVILTSFDKNLDNKSGSSSNAIPNGNLSYSLNTERGMGYCIDLDGSSYLTIAHNESLNLSGDWTIEAWIKVGSYSSALQYIVNKPGDNDNYQANYALQLQPWWDNVLHGFYFSDTETRINVTDMKPSLDQWYHVRFTRNVADSEISIVVHDINWNEISSNSREFSGTDVLLSSKDLRIGEGFIGSLDELRISTADQIRQDINLSTGWNILSFNVEPDNTDLLDVVQPLIDDEILHKIIDEGGNILQHMPWGWVNNIGDIANTEGYYIKVNSDVSLSIYGTIVPCPFDIDLYTGWNIMGYPCQNPEDAIAVLQALIDAGKVSKVIDEGGNILQYMPWGWVNNIGDLLPGEGYYIKLSENASITFEEPGEPTSLKTKYSGIETSETEFFMNSHPGNPYLPMTIVLTDVDNLGYDSEIGIFDGDLCVGAGIINNDKIYISAAADDPYTPEIDGFINGNTITIKVFDRVHGRAYVLEPELIQGDYRFSPLETYIGSLKSCTKDLLKTGLENNYLGLSFPNPASDYTTIEYGLAETSSVTLTVYNQLGKTISVLNITDQPSGIHQYIIDWKNLGQGIYYYRLVTKGESGYFIETKKMIVNKY